ncbi:hypothetical protein COO60DRAFT_1511819, partial [Scenedesmus sp. NREL 46B-D3]
MAVIFANKAISHVEGGWPKDVNCSEAEHTISTGKAKWRQQQSFEGVLQHAAAQLMQHTPTIRRVLLLFLSSLGCAQCMQTFWSSAPFSFRSSGARADGADAMACMGNMMMMKKACALAALCRQGRSPTNLCTLPAPLAGLQNNAIDIYQEYFA